MKRKLVSILFVLIFALIMVGCANSNDPNANGSNGNTNDSGNNQTENSDDPVKFSIAMRTFAKPYVENHPEINDDKYVEKLEELTNTDLNIRLIPHNGYSERMLLMLASDDKPDVMQGVGLYGSELGGGVEEGAFLPLNDLLEEHGQNLLEFIPEAAWEQMTHTDGQIYAIPEFLSKPSRRGMAIRMDLLEQTGLDIPETTDEYLEVLRAFKELGVENPFQGRENFHYADTFFGAFDAFPYQWQYEEETDRIVPKFVAQDGEKAKKALDYYKTMYEEGLIHSEFFTIPQPEYRSSIISGNAGMWSMNAEEVVSWEKEMRNHVPEADVAIIPAPKEPGGRGGHYYYQNVTRSYFINSETEVDPAEIIKFFDWQVTEEAQEFFTFGIEGEDYTKENGEINYELKDDEQFLNTQDYRTSWLWMVRDATYTEGILELTEEGQSLIKVFDDILAHEGHGTIGFHDGIQVFKDIPDIDVSGVLAPEFWLTEAAKIITGREPVDYHDQIIENWLNRGGEQAIEEATQRYHAGDYSSSDPEEQVE